MASLTAPLRRYQSIVILQCSPVHHTRTGSSNCNEPCIRKSSAQYVRTACVSQWFTTSFGFSNLTRLLFQGVSPG